MKTGSKYQTHNKRNRIILLPMLWIFIWLFSRTFFISSPGVLNTVERVTSTSPIPEDDIEISLRPPLVLPSTPQQQTSFNFNSSKKILYFNNYFHLTDWRFGFGNEPFISAKCPQTNCFVTNDRKLLGSLADFDAILFHARDMDRRVIQVRTAAHHASPMGDMTTTFYVIPTAAFAHKSQQYLGAQSAKKKKSSALCVFPHGVTSE